MYLKNSCIFTSVKNKNKDKMDYEKFYKTTTKQELFEMVLELSSIANYSRNEEGILVDVRKFVRGQIDSVEY